MAVSYAKDEFSILVLSIRKRYPSFLKKVFRLPENLFQDKLFKTFKIFTVTWKHPDLSKGVLFWKPLVRFFRRIYALSVSFKMKPLRKSVFQCFVFQFQPKFCWKTCWKEQPFICTLNTWCIMEWCNGIYNRT